MPIDWTGAGAAGVGAVGGALGMIGQRGREKRQHKRTKKLMGLQQQNQKELNQQGADIAYDMWQKTNYSAQMDQMRKAGLNVGMMYGGGGGAGGTTSAGSGGSAAMGSAPMSGDSPEMMGIQQAMDAKMMAQNIKESDSRIAVNEANAAAKGGYEKDESESRTNWNKMKTGETQANTELINANYDKVTTEIMGMKTDNLTKKQDLIKTTAEAATMELELEIKEKYGMDLQAAENKKVWNEAAAIYKNAITNTTNARNAQNMTEIKYREQIADQVKKEADIARDKKKINLEVWDKVLKTVETAIKVVPVGKLLNNITKLAKGDTNTDPKWNSNFHNDRDVQK